MKKELQMRAKELENETLKTLYFGGGTPSVLTVEQITELINEVQKYFHFSQEIEITLEANPDDLSKEYLEQLSLSPMNRLSIGIQSFHASDLEMMNRAHTPEQALEAVKNAQSFGFDNISIDLIYGNPTADFEVWKRNLETIVALDIPHISAYALTVEPKTALENWVKRKKVAAPDDEIQQQQFEYMISFLEAHGYQQYEISNFAKPNFHSKHNSAYWQHLPYLGIGPSAHSFDGKNKRSWNIANNAKYIQTLEKEMLPSESELLSMEDAYNERMMIGLRTAMGVDIEQIYTYFPETIVRYFEKKKAEKIRFGELVEREGRLCIPKEKWFFADGIAADMFYT
ncbi:hypothetical protein HMPREF9700_00697 [Bergeyella zoohelcum CCUG 30536]|uniref:Heme chaperone HemW n=2 Tax=Bergeyella zoohelcum TaxID=1015 RepID=A0A376BYS8_9FLAO|nr:hypothetical protein HMPREF9700_00697 [Bergeyella zoohelcum CCUG 30536]SSZ46707.1 Oxygen-independent coproporphyrinogen-III oxidase [Bergeyella zoohelcum]